MIICKTCGSISYRHTQGRWIVIISIFRNDVSLSGNRLRLLRESRKTTQQELALLLSISTDEVEQMECGVTICDTNRLAAIKTALDAEFLPLIDEEYPTFKERLYLWRDLIRNRQLDNAVELHGKISGIVDLDVDLELIALYRMFEITLHIVQGKIKEVEKTLDEIDMALINVNAEIRYYYNRNAGTLNFVIEDFDKALRYYLKALKIGKTKKQLLMGDDSIYFNIALCYSHLHLPHHALEFLREFNKVNTSDRTNRYSWHLDNAYASNCIRINRMHDAEGLLKKCLSRGEASNDKTLIAVSLHNYGSMYYMEKNFFLAFYYYEQAYNQHKLNPSLQLDSYYCMIRCSMEIGKYRETNYLLDDSDDLLNKEKNPLLNDDTIQVYTMLFQALRYLKAILQRRTEAYSDRSLDQIVDYMEETVIPYLLSTHRYTHALDYCNVLTRYFRKALNHKKALAIQDIAVKIYRKMLYDQGDLV